MENRSVLKNRIRLYRFLSGYTQQHLASVVGVSKNTISSLECNTAFPSARLAYILCRTFGCNFEDLFYFDDQTSPVQEVY